MKIWYDACTGKHVRYGVAIARRLRSLGHEVILTTREHLDTLPLANLLNESFITIGKYDPSSPSSRLMEGLRRQMSFYEMFKDEAPDIAISHCSVDLCRVAYGLGVPIVLTYDSPYAEAVSRLTIPLADFLVVSKAVPKLYLKRYGARNVVTFDGVDEVAWAKGFEPSVKYDYERPLIVVRQFEVKASYALGRPDPMEGLARKLTKFGTVVFLPRYDRAPREGLVVPEEFVDTASLVAQADLAVGAGGTIVREAALQGVPAISIPLAGRVHVNDYLTNKGFPMFTMGERELLRRAAKLIGERWDVKGLLEGLENPIDVVERILNTIEGVTSTKGHLTARNVNAL